MQRLRDLRRAYKRLWFGGWILALVGVVAGLQWRLTGDIPLRTQVLGQSVKATPAPTIKSGPSGAVASTSATFTYSDSETAVTFQCSLDSPTLGSCPTSGTTWNGLSQGLHTFRVQAQGISASPVTTRTWTVDTQPPPAPLISSGPENPTIETSPTFVFSGEDGASFQCALDGATQSCTSPFAYKKVSAADHTFTVTAIDAAGNRSAASTPYPWTVLINKAFGISGDAAGPLYPGMTASPLNLKISNPYNFPIEIVSIDVVPSATGTCGTANLDIHPLLAAHSTQMIVPANSAPLLSDVLNDPQWERDWPADWPTILLKDTAGNQDVCSNVTFTLRYSGTATKP